ncbi:hypothetical protein M8C21_033321, partial [Ambrosia artemisiifolia]
FSNEIRFQHLGSGVVLTFGFNPFDRSSSNRSIAKSGFPHLLQPSINVVYTPTSFINSLLSKERNRANASEHWEFLHIPWNMIPHKIPLNHGIKNFLSFMHFAT